MRDTEALLAGVGGLVVLDVAGGVVAVAADVNTPAEAWMRGPSREFVRDLLSSSQARARGLFDVEAVLRHLDAPEGPQWFNVAWKLVAVEA